MPISSPSLLFPPQPSTESSTHSRQLGSLQEVPCGLWVSNRWVFGFRRQCSNQSTLGSLPIPPKKESDRVPWDHQDGSRFLSLGKNFLSSSVKFPACRNCVKQLASVIKQLLLVSITEKKMKLPSPKRPHHPNPEMPEEINIKIHI